MIPNDLESQLIRDEGEILHAYQDSLGYWTIGVGRLIDPKRGGGISKSESGILLDADILKSRTAVLAALPWASQVGEIRRAALVNMHFQLGDGLFGFRNTLDLIRTGQVEAAAAAMLQSKWATQTPERAKRLSEQIRTGTWQ